MEYRIIKRVKLNILHQSTGRTVHYSGGKELDKPAELIIGKYSEDPGYYLIYLDRDGEELTDTYHESADEAMNQAEFEFGVGINEWDEEE